MGALKNIVAAAGLLAAAGIGETVYFYNRTMKRGHAKPRSTVVPVSSPTRLQYRS